MAEGAVEPLFSVVGVSSEPIGGLIVISSRLAKLGGSGVRKKNKKFVNMRNVGLAHGL